VLIGELEACSDICDRVSVGLFCAVQCMMGAWGLYRVSVTALHPDTATASVMFIDYGCFETVPIDSLMCLNDELTSRQPFAIRWVG